MKLSVGAQGEAPSPHRVRIFLDETGIDVPLEPMKHRWHESVSVRSSARA